MLIILCRTWFTSDNIWFCFLWWFGKRICKTTTMSGALSVLLRACPKHRLNWLHPIAFPCHASLTCTSTSRHSYPLIKCDHMAALLRYCFQKVHCIWTMNALIIGTKKTWGRLQQLWPSRVIDLLRKIWPEKRKQQLWRQWKISQHF